MEIPIDRQLFFLNQKLTGWQNTYFDAKIDVKMGTDIENAKMINEGTERMRVALEAIAWLEKEITRVEGGDISE